MNKRKRIISAVLAIFLALLMLSSIIVTIATSVSAKAVSQSELDALRAKASDLAEQKSKVADEISGLQSQKASIIDQKNMLDNNIDLTEEEIDNLSQQIDLLTQDISDKEEAYNEAVEQEDEQTDLFRKRVREMEENGDISYLSIVFDAKSFSDLLSLVDSVTDVMNYDQWVVNQLKDAQAATLEAKNELETTKADAEQSKQEQENKKVELQQELSDADELMKSVEADIDTNQTQYDQIEDAETQAAQDIDDMVAALEKKAKEEAAAKAAAEAAAKKAAASSSSGSSGSTSVTSTGTYIWPSASSIYVTSLFGTRLHPVYHVYKTHYGIDIGASYGTDILAADGGTVVTSEYSSSYGNYVMISHGNGRYTLYGHMSQRLVSVGDTVTQGETIGLVGSTGISTGPHIHFEVYENGTRVDPLQFFSNYIVTGW